MTYIEPTWPYAQIDREIRTPSSVEISRNAAGKPSWSIKVFSEVGKEDDAMAKAIDLDEQLQAAFWQP